MAPDGGEDRVEDGAPVRVVELLEGGSGGRDGCVFRFVVGDADVLCPSQNAIADLAKPRGKAADPLDGFLVPFGVFKCFELALCFLCVEHQPPASGTRRTKSASVLGPSSTVSLRVMTCAPSRKTKNKPS